MLRVSSTLMLALLATACGGDARSDSRQTLDSGVGDTGNADARSCAEIENDYYAALEQALGCLPEMSSLQCTAMVDVGLQCACPSALNERESVAIATLAALEEEYAAALCLRDVLCAECMAMQGGGCGLDGHCVTYGPD